MPFLLTTWIFFGFLVHRLAYSSTVFSKL
ncbi:hypothetical protein BpHYR1_027464 [Brachionus plicatilis]|uniref:Uncharacterized protein n=1 Tax=Brachionus plicatilis TaxID=10195 RepID=A0A3M7P1V0_BRAPC|nr:hypothetical protein BpHYR1_027464 [Brachionus plicatilis]